jgi:hypothetical protein
MSILGNILIFFDYFYKNRFKMFYISFHGGKNSLNNIHVYDHSGNPSSTPKLLKKDKSKVKLKELRAFQFVGNLLYVVNGYKDYSQVLTYTPGKNGQYDFKEVFADGKNADGIFHPYDLTFDENGNCYVSNQDSNVVIGINEEKQVMDKASFLTQNYSPVSNFFDGTIIASSIGDLPKIEHTPPPNVSIPQGLYVSFTNDKGKEKVAHSVRGVFYYNDFLFVSDEPANAVKVYAMPSGKLHATIKGDNLASPVQLLEHKNVLYIGSSGNGSVVTVDLSPDFPSGTIAPTTFIDNEVPSISGMLFDDEGNFYAAERKANTILKFPSNGGAKEVFISGLKDNPEFIVYVPKSK